MPIVVVVSFLGASLLGIAALGASSMRSAKLLGGSALVLLIFVALMV